MGQVTAQGRAFAPCDLSLSPCGREASPPFPLAQRRSGTSADDTVPRLARRRHQPEEGALYSPPEWAGGPHSSAMPWPWRTDTVLLVLVLKFSRSRGERRETGLTTRSPRTCGRAPRLQEQGPLPEPRPGGFWRACPLVTSPVTLGPTATLQGGLPTRPV